MKIFCNIYNKFLNLKFIDKLKHWISKFIDSEFYIILLLLASVVNWKFQVIWIIFSVGVLMFSLILIFNINRMRLVPLALFAIISLRLENNTDYIMPVIVGSIIIIPALIYDLLKKNISFNNKIFIGMIFLLIAMFFSIVNAPDLLTPTLGILMWVFYTFIFLYIYNKRREQNTLENNRLYIAKSMMYLGIGIFIQIILFYFEFREGENPIDFFGDKHIQLGWGITNFIAMLYLMIIPLTAFYYIKNQKRYFLLIIIFIHIVSFSMMLSRGAYLAVLITIIPFLIKFLADIKDKTAFTKYFLVIVIFILFGTLIYAIPSGIVKSFFEALNVRGLSLSGRELLYNIGLSVFYRYPLFGGGIYTSKYYISIAAESVYYHNFIIHTLATIGIVGALGFIYYLYQILKQTLINEDYNIYVFFIVVNLIIHGLFDTTFYNPLVMVVLSLILPMMNEKKLILDV